MDIDLLNEFIILSQCLNYSQAAQKLYISQSVLSRHIQNLESQLGVELFTRNKHSVALTPIGKIFAEDVEKVVRQYDKAMKHVQMAKEGTMGIIEVRNSSILSPMFIYDFLPEFKRKYPDITINIDIDDVGGHSQKLITESKPDLVIMLDWMEDNHPDIESMTFFRNNLYAFLADEHPLAKRTEIYVEELSELPMIYLNTNDKDCSIPFFRQLFAKYHAIYNPCIEAQNLESLFLKILTGEGISILSELVFKHTPSKIAAIPIANPEAFINTNVIWNKNTPNTCVPVFVHEFSHFINTFRKEQLLNRRVSDE